MVADLADMAARVAVLETKMDLALRLSAAVAIPVWVQFVQMIARKVKGERRK